MSMEAWPNFLIVGAPKAGTTSLYFYLRSNPQIFLSPVKEPRFFNSPSCWHVYRKKISDKNEYLKLFKKVKKEKAVGEASTSYLEDPESPFLIKKSIPMARIIIILRDPVERAFSHHTMDIRGNKTYVPLDKVIRMDEASFKKHPEVREVLTAGFYSESIKRYLDIFGKEKVKIIIFEEFIEETKDKVEEICRFLGVDPTLSDFTPEIWHAHFEERIPYSHYFWKNKIVFKIARSLLAESTRMYFRDKFLTKKANKPKMKLEDKNFLEDLYRSDALKTQEIIGSSLPWPFITQIQS